MWRQTRQAVVWKGITGGGTGVDLIGMETAIVPQDLILPSAPFFFLHTLLGQSHPQF